MYNLIIHHGYRTTLCLSAFIVSKAAPFDRYFYHSCTRSIQWQTHINIQLYPNVYWLTTAAFLGGSFAKGQPKNALSLLSTHRIASSHPPFCHDTFVYYYVLALIVVHY